jgi:UDP-N-acetylmuramyl pentapeptide synthase
MILELLLYKGETMKKIVARFLPLEPKQTIYAYEDGNKIDMLTVRTETEELNQALDELIQKHDIDEIVLFGPVQFSRGIGERFKTYELVKYGAKAKSVNITYR